MFWVVAAAAVVVVVAVAAVAVVVLLVVAVAVVAAAEYLPWQWVWVALDGPPAITLPARLRWSHLGQTIATPGDKHVDWGELYAGKDHMSLILPSGNPKTN